MQREIPLLRIAVFLAAAVGFAWFLIPIGWHVLNIGNASGLAVCLLLMVLAACWGKIRAAGEHSKPVRVFFTALVVLLCAGAVWSGAMTVCMLSGAAAAPAEDGVAVVLGSMVNGTSPSADLWSRIAAASSYLKEHPGVKCIASGGQGPGESVTEASVIKECLVADGIDADRILTEERSRSTKENLSNSMELAAQNGLGRKFAIITDDYHEFRACSVARKLGLEPYAVPAKTPWFILSSCWGREVLALTKYLILPS
jgi:uncharacterized SAM-binding protein YcdF (DUF218 family)